MATPKVMKLINPNTGEMECRVCGAFHFASFMPNARDKFRRGSWQCPYGCKLEDLEVPDHRLREAWRLLVARVPGLQGVTDLGFFEMEELMTGDWSDADPQSAAEWVVDRERLRALGFVKWNEPLVPYPATGDSQ